MFAAVDWLYSKVALRFPDLKICLSEGGIGWVAGLLDRLDHVGRYQTIFGTWEGVELTPREVMQRNFWFCTIDDIAGLEQRHRIGVDHLLLESDYPHQDGTWPDTQAIVWSQIGGFPSRRDRAAGVAQRLRAVPPPGARGAAARSRRRPADRPVSEGAPMYERDHLYIGGEWVAPVDGGRVDVVNPATEAVIGHAPLASAPDVARAVAAARRRVRARSVAAHGARRARRRAGRDGRVADASGRARSPSSTSTRPACRSPSRAQRELGPVAIFELLRAAHARVPVPRGAAGRAGAGAGACANRSAWSRAVVPFNGPLDVGRGEDRAGLGVGLPDRVQAGARDAARRVRARRSGRGRRHPARRAQHRARRAPTWARRSCAHPGVDRVVFTGSTAGGRAHRGAVRRDVQARDARARRQGRRDPARRCADRAVDRGHPADVVLQQRAGVHRAESRILAPRAIYEDVVEAAVATAKRDDGRRPARRGRPCSGP